MYKNADLDYDGIQEAIANLENIVHDEAEGCYRRGVNFFVNEKLTEAILRLIDDKTLREKLGQAGRDIAKNYSAEESSKLFEEFYLECINAHNRQEDISNHG